MNVHQLSLKRLPYAGQVLIAVAALLWSSSGAVFRGVSIPSIQFLIIRSGFTVIVLSPFVWSRVVKKRLRQDALRFLLSSFSFTLYTFGFILTTRNIGAATAITMQYSAPVYLFFVYLIIERKIVLKRDYPKLIMIATLMVNGIWTTMRVASLSYLFPAYMCGIGYALFTWSVKKLSHHSPMLIVASNNLLGLVFYIPFLLLTGEPFRALSGVELTIVVLVSLVVNTFSYVIFSAGLQSVKTLDASLITLIEPLMNPILVILVLREIPASMDILILFIILSSLVLDLVHSHTVLIQRR